MKRSYIFKNEQSEKFWNIDASGLDYCVHYGAIGKNGTFQIKEFESEADCLKAAEKLISSKLKKGYLEREENNDRYFYYDDSEHGPHPKTSHPNFSNHFKSDFYYDCGDEEAPFGSDEGADTLGELVDYIKKNQDVDIYDFPRELVEEIWDMKYYEPEFSIENITDEGVIGDVFQSDQVTIASALGQIKIMGKVSNRLKDKALTSLLRIGNVCKQMNWNESYLAKQMYDDLSKFDNDDNTIPSELAKNMIDYLDCPCEVFNNLLDDDNMIYAYEKALIDGKSKGYTPLLIVVSETLYENMTMMLSDEGLNLDKDGIKQYRERTIEKSTALNFDELIEKFKSELDEDELPKVKKVSGGHEIDRFSCFWNYEINLSKEVLLAKIPTTKPWELPIFVPMGGFNSCPLPEEQAFIMKLWHEKYGAIPAILTYEEWELLLPKPATENDDEAIKLAWEHYYFCFDRVEQYDENYTIGKLADCIKKSKVWYFWWD